MNELSKGGRRSGALASLCLPLIRSLVATALFLPRETSNLRIDLSIGFLVKVNWKGGHRTGPAKDSTG